MMEHVQGQTFHKRRGAIKNTFHYGVDYVLCDLDSVDYLALLSRNRFNLWSIWDHKHGGQRDAGTGKAWFREVLDARNFPLGGADLLLLAQPSFLWFNFNPVCFWIAMRDGQACAIVAEVNNTFGDRHCYFCANDGFAPITADTLIEAEKLMHVSPFQEVAGRYTFRFDLTDAAINIRINYENDDAGVLATLVGKRRLATNRSLLWAALRRPLGALRVVSLIHWQALVLWIKRAPFRSVPPPPENLISTSKPVGKPTK